MYLHRTPTQLFLAPFAALLVVGCQPPTPDGGDGVCNEWMPVDGGGTYTYETTNDGEPPFQWTQELLPRDDDGFYPLQSDLPEGSSTLFYRCNDGDVELVRSESDAGGISATETYDPPWLAWPGGAPDSEQAWVSIVDVTVAAAGVTQSQRKTGNWEIREANVEAITDGGDTWPNSVVFHHTSSLIVDGETITETEENTITSLDGPGLVWSDVITTTWPGGVEQTAESITELIGYVE